MLELTKMNNINNNFKQELIDNGYNEIIVNLLVNRGYDEETICTLLSTGYSEELPIYNDLTNVQIGADIIESHIANGSRIYIYGDYDSDGVNSTYILGDAINNAIYYSNSSAQLSLKVPERCEGYGLNMSWCQSIVANKTTDTLVITVDNGIAQDQEVAYLLDNGIDVLITDHHTPNGHTPANVWIIDAFHNNDNENNKGLCGAGVAFKLAMSLLDRFQCVPNIDELYYKYIVHVAIATITDSMPMTIDNIKYVYNGIQLLKDGYGSEAVTYYRDYNSNTDLTPKDIAFGLGPQINACGRMNNTALALNYLFSDNEDVEDLYNEVVVTNDERKAKTKSSIEQAEKMLDIESPSIVLELDGIEGIAGIIASNLSSKYNKCTIIFSKDMSGKYLIGSARNDGRVDLLNILRSINNNSVVKVGGHSAACGITIKASRIKSFIKELNEILSSLPKEEVEEVVDTKIVVDDYISISDINKDNCESLKDLYFFTESNPVFALTNVTITKTKASNNNKNNMMFSITDSDNNKFEFWSWGIGEQYRALGEPKNVTFIGEIEYKFGKPSFNILNIVPMEMISIC
jgi:single-stranded-DNA-specific exonuclease